MSVYTKEAMDALREARRNNPNVSQRGLARNIFMLTDLNRRYISSFNPVISSTNDLSQLLGHPSEVALQHLIRGIDRQARNEVSVAAAAARVTANRRPRNRKPRNVKTVGRGRRITV